MHKQYFVYILASDTHELYVGVTNDLSRRYSYRHGTTRLVYFEMTTDVRSAIQREKALKRFPRQRKLELIEGMNPEWRNLATNSF